MLRCVQMDLSPEHANGFKRIRWIQIGPKSSAFEMIAASRDYEDCMNPEAHMGSINQEKNFSCGGLDSTVIDLVRDPTTGLLPPFSDWFGKKYPQLFFLSSSPMWAPRGVLPHLTFSKKFRKNKKTHILFLFLWAVSKNILLRDPLP